MEVGPGSVQALDASLTALALAPLSQAIVKSGSPELLSAEIGAVHAYKRVALGPLAGPLAVAKALAWT